MAVTWERLAYLKETNPLWKILTGEIVLVHTNRQYLVMNTLDLAGTIQLEAGAELIIGRSDVATMSPSSGWFDKYCSEATATLSGAFTIIPVAIPDNSYIEAVQLRVDTAVTGATSWNAYFSGGNASVICTAQALAKNTKVNSLSGGYCNGATNITILKTGSDFTGGVIRAVCYYRKLTAMEDAP